jgi:hypothetical protein
LCYYSFCFFKQKIYFSLLLDEDIDGQTLALLQQNDIMLIFPRIKDRVKFVDLREKLISNLNEEHEDIDETAGHFFDLTLSLSFKSLSAAPTNEIPPGSSFSNENRELADDIDSTADLDHSSLHNSSDDIGDFRTTTKLPVDFEGPALTMRMKQYVDENDLKKFNPHTAMRGELLTLLFDDVTKSHQVL